MNKEGNKKREVLHPFFSSKKIPSLEALFRRGVEPRSALCVFPTAAVASLVVAARLLANGTRLPS